ncbi:hypothetical protein [Pseudoalteromonas piscicida]|uniref:hypothetical protein n=1 Tax=Pseudoalteromonas piscicida TaxID=43662 RepID=UPI0032BF636C
MKNSWYFFLLVILMTAAFAAIHYYTDFAYQIHTMVLLLVLTCLSRQLVNLQHISAALLAITAVEYVLIKYILELSASGLPAYQGNGFIFGSHLIVDFVTLLFLKYRVSLSLRYIKHTSSNNWRSIYMTHADPILYGIYFAFILVDLAAFGENIIRNLEHFGVDESFAKQFWSWGLIYYNYEILKSILLSCVITTLLATIFVERQRPDTPDEELDSES